MLDRILTPQGRRQVVAGFHSLHAALEPGLALWLSDVEGLGFAARRRTDRLGADLRALGVSAAQPDPVPPPGSRAEALGRLYVLEGSALGGRVIRKQVARAGDDLTGLSFLDPYGDRLGETWRAFLAVLEREAPGEIERRRVVAGARTAFRHAEACLAPERADV